MTAFRRVSMLALAAASMTLTACVKPPRPMYHWEGFQAQIYQHLKQDGGSPDEQLQAMLAQAEKARGTHTALPPGFRAHMGMLYLRLGRGAEARSALEAEKLSFPESAPYMDFLLKRMQSPQPASEKTRS